MAKLLKKRVLRAIVLRRKQGQKRARKSFVEFDMIPLGVVENTNASVSPVLVLRLNFMRVFLWLLEHNRNVNHMTDSQLYGFIGSKQLTQSALEKNLMELGFKVVLREDHRDRPKYPGDAFSYQQNFVVLAHPDLKLLAWLVSSYDYDYNCHTVKKAYVRGVVSDKSYEQMDHYGVGRYIAVSSTSNGRMLTWNLKTMVLNYEWGTDHLNQILDSLDFLDWNNPGRPWFVMYDDDPEDSELIAYRAVRHVPDWVQVFMLPETGFKYWFPRGCLVQSRTPIAVKEKDTAVNYYFSDAMIFRVAGVERNSLSGTQYEIEARGDKHTFEMRTVMTEQNEEIACILASSVPTVFFVSAEVFYKHFRLLSASPANKPHAFVSYRDDFKTQLTDLKR